MQSRTAGWKVHCWPFATECEVQQEAETVDGEILQGFLGGEWVELK